MKQKKKVMTIVVYSILLLIIAEINNKYSFIMIPLADEMVSRQIDFITISTVFAGFSFTALGLLLGLSSEALIEKIKNTSILMNKAGRIINSIIFFILSVVISVVFVLGMNPLNLISGNIAVVLDNILYILCIGYLIIGISYFVYAVYELYDLIKRVYGHNKKETEEEIAIIESQMQQTRKKMRKNDMYQE